MDSLKQVGKNLKATERETQQNSRRISENFNLPERMVGSFNNLHPYRTVFNAADTLTTAHLNIKISPLTVPCTVNPPILDVKATVYHAFDNPGELHGLTSTSVIDPPNPDYTQVGNDIILPVDGCYGVLWESGAWGAGYFAGKHVTVGLLHEEASFRTIVQPSTGILQVLGPEIFFYAPATPIYGVMEAKAGDRFTAFLTQEDISQGYPWIGQEFGLRGFFYNPKHVPHTVLTIELIAEAEG